MRKALAVLFVSLLSFVAVPLDPAMSGSAFGVTAQASKTQLTLGTAFTLSGTVSPSSSGKTVNIQRRYAGGSWVTILRRTLTSASKYSAAITPVRGGPTDYRVVKPASASRSIGISPTRRVNVFRWRYLSDVPYSIGDAAEAGSYTINGNTFTKSFEPLNGGFVWDYGPLRCTKFETYVGIDDAAPAGTGGTADEYFYDAESGIGVSQPDLVRGQDPRYVQHTLGTYDDQLYLYNDPIYSNFYLVYANPRVYCNS